MSDGVTGQQGVTDANSESNIGRFHIDQAMAESRTAMMVKVVKVTGGGIGPAGTVDVQPLINQVDGLGKPTPHDTIYGQPWAREQAGDFAFINDPQVGDVGQLKIHDRDHSGLQGDGKPVNPGSKRRSSPSDGVYHGAVKMGGTPKRYIMAKPDGGLVLVDRAGNRIETFPDHVAVTPKDGGTVFLGGDGSKGSYDFVSTVSGPSINVKARIG